MMLLLFWRLENSRPDELSPPRIVVGLAAPLRDQVRHSIARSAVAPQKTREIIV